MPKKFRTKERIVRFVFFKQEKQHTGFPTKGFAKEIVLQAIVLKFNVLFSYGTDPKGIKKLFKT